MKVKVTEASGALLDYLVARCEGYDCQFDDEVSGPWLVPQEGYLHDERSLQGYDPSLKWSLGGPIKTRNRVSTEIKHDGWWVSCIYNINDDPTYMQIAHDELIAAMRCYCYSILGECVDVPEELCQQHRS